MDDVLSQSEIDSLIAALSTGELDTEDLKLSDTVADKVTDYDFKRPNKFSKEQLRTLQLVHDGFARMLASFLTGYLRTNVQLKVASVDQVTYEDYVRSIPTPTLLTGFSMEPLKGSAVMETDCQFIFPIIDLLFGGKGEMPLKVRELTEIELSVLRQLNVKILETLGEAWVDIYEIEPKIESQETNPRLQQSISPNETVAVITFSTEIGRSEGIINLCIPFVTLDPVISKLSARYMFSSLDNMASSQQSEFLENLVGKAVVELDVQLGGTVITVQDFLSLQEGDVIKLDKKTDWDLNVFVEGNQKFFGQLGVLGSNLALQITNLVEGALVND